MAAVEGSLEKALLVLPRSSSLCKAAASAAGPASGKSSTLHQLSKERRREGERRRVPHRGGATMAQAAFGQKPNCCKQEKNQREPVSPFPFSSNACFALVFIKLTSFQWPYRLQTSCQEAAFVDYTTKNSPQSSQKWCNNGYLWDQNNFLPGIFFPSAF